MRQLASLLLIALALPVAAAEIWRWKDANGVVHYSDQPGPPGATRVDQVPGPAATPPGAAASTAPRLEQPAPEFRYTACVVATPANDTVFNAVNTVDVSLQITPGLRPDHRLQVILDGKVHADWPARATGSTLLGLYRGTHTLAVQVLDADARAVCAGPVTSFHVRLPSLLSPGRPATPNPGVKPAPKP